MAYINLNKKNYFNNLDIITKQTKSIDKIALVLKDNAYGHGIVEVARMAQEYGISKAVVQNYDEASKIQEFFEYILVLADSPKEVNSKIRYTINDLESIKKFPKGTLVELKVDTGMHRNGVKMDELYTAFVRIKEQGLILEALFTHHRSADELSSEWFWQTDNFKKVKVHANELAREFGCKELRFHSSNSAALFRDSNFSEDMARVGIAAYGCMELPSALKPEGFKPVLSLYARKLSSRDLKRGQCVGYGGAYRAEKNEVVSNYDFGYGHGFLRACADGYKTPDGYKIVGRISMDNSSFLCDKDEILLFNDARELSRVAQTIAYEILTSLKAGIQRKTI